MDITKAMVMVTTLVAEELTAMIIGLADITVIPVMNIIMIVLAIVWKEDFQLRHADLN
jgi:hypothetical protein